MKKYTLLAPTTPLNWVCQSKRHKYDWRWLDKPWKKHRLYTLRAEGRQHTATTLSADESAFPAIINLAPPVI